MNQTHVNNIIIVDDNNNFVIPKIRAIYSYFKFICIEINK